MLDVIFDRTVFCCAISPAHKWCHGMAMAMAMVSIPRYRIERCSPLSKYKVEKRFDSAAAESNSQAGVGLPFVQKPFDASLLACSPPWEQNADTGVDGCVGTGPLFDPFSILFERSSLEETGSPDSLVFSRRSIAAESNSPAGVRC